MCYILCVLVPLCTREFLTSASKQLFFVNIHNRSGSSAFRFSWAASFCMSVLKYILEVKWSFKIIVILMTSLLLLMLYMLMIVLPAGSVGNTAVQFISTWSFSPALKVLGETGNPRCVPFRGWLKLHLQQRCSLGINPPLILTCCILAWLTAVLSSLLFGELWPGSWAMSVYQLPPSSKWQCEFKEVVSFKHPETTDVLKMSGGSD